jgi:hypothetical protein
MRKRGLRLLIFFSLLAGTGCKSIVDTFDYSALISPLLATGAGVLAYKLTDDRDQYSENEQLAITALSAGGTYIASEAVRAKVKKDFDDEFMKGYDLGASDAVKRQYWIMQNLNRTQTGAKERDAYRYYTFPGAESAGGVNYSDHEITVRTRE